MAVLTRGLPAVLLALTLGFSSSVAIADHDKRKSGNTIVDKLIATDGAQALVAAVLVADEFNTTLDFKIAEVLSDDDSKFTLFAPSNAAFEDLLNALFPDSVPSGATNGLEIGDIQAILIDLAVSTGDPGAFADTVVGVLLKHVASRKKSVEKLLKKGEVEVTDGSSFPVSIGASGVSINYETTIIKGNVWAGNGIIHFIDTVILDAGDNGGDDGGETNG